MANIVGLLARVLRYFVPAHIEGWVICEEDGDKSRFLQNSCKGFSGTVFCNRFTAECCLREILHELTVHDAQTNFDGARRLVAIEEAFCKLHFPVGDKDGIERNRALTEESKELRRQRAQWVEDTQEERYNLLSSKITIKYVSIPLNELSETIV